MKLALLTGHSPRHNFLASYLSNICDEMLVVSETGGLNPAIAGSHGNFDAELVRWFEDRFEAECDAFPARGFPSGAVKVLNVLPNELNGRYVFEVVKEFNPDLVLVFGTSLIKGPLLSTNWKIVNLHLGISPYYNGAGTNWWPMFNQEFDLVGGTIHFIDEGVDTGPIICHVRATLIEDMSPHDIGNATIFACFRKLRDLCPLLAAADIEPVKQWSVKQRPVYKMRDFNAIDLLKFKKDFENGSLKTYLLKREPKNYKLVNINGTQSYLVDEYCIQGS